MSSLEKMIVESVYSEERFEQVSFLDEKDFTNLTYGFYWGLISKFKGDVITALGTLEIEGRKDLCMAVYNFSTLSGCNNLERIATEVVEMRFKRLLIHLLTDLSKETKNRLESEMLNECILAVPNNDVFELSYGILEYIGHQASALTKKRITDYLKYVDGRCDKIKNVINGTK